MGEVGELATALVVVADQLIGTDWRLLEGEHRPHGKAASVHGIRGQFPTREFVTLAFLPDTIVSAQGLVHGVREPVAHAGQHVAVGVQGNGYCGVTQELLHEFDVHTFAEQEGCAGMPQVMKTYVR